MVARLAILFALATALSHGCMCADPPSVEKVLARSQAVFVGRVVDNWLDQTAVRISRYRLLRRWMGDRSVRFEIQESFLGKQTGAITVLTDFAGCTCDFLPG